MTFNFIIDFWEPHSWIFKNILSTLKFDDTSFIPCFLNSFSSFNLNDPTFILNFDCSIFTFQFWWSNSIMNNSFKFHDSTFIIELRWPQFYGWIFLTLLSSLHFDDPLSSLNFWWPTFAVKNLWLHFHTYILATPISSMKFVDSTFILAFL